MRWPELNLVEATWIIPNDRTKNAEQHIVHLSPQAMSVIQSIAEAR
jgi:hypothetical protein